ncbi:MAG TPA: pirin family protein [Acidimicrobiales bacterium]
MTSRAAEPVAADDHPTGAELEISESRTAQVGALPVRRALPRRGRRTVGAWCFLDHMGPADLAPGGLDIAPHPHIGLQTVTWLVSGAVLHRDSLGTEQVIRPGQLNLMTAGHGVAHSEEDPGGATGPLHGVQLWVAQPAATRNGAPAFEHHPELPQAELGQGTATVLVGRLADGGAGAAASPARRDTDHLGVELDLRGPSTLPLEPGHEHTLVPLSGAVAVEGRVVEPGHLVYLGTGRDELGLAPAGSGSGGAARAILVGGAPFPEPVLMWWNYVARTRDEITAAHQEWTGRTDRFGTVRSPLPPIDVGLPPWASG